MADSRPFHWRDYKKLLSYQRTLVIFLVTCRFVNRFLERGDRTIDQMIQAARSSKQNIIEGADAAMGSKSSEIFLTNVALASLGELKEDYLDYLRVRNLRIWEKDDRETKYVRQLCSRNGGHYKEYREFVETRTDEVVANIAITLICQAQLLLHRQIKGQWQRFLEEGGVRENMMKLRKAARERQRRYGKI